jgi:hypothetical protein
MKTKILTTLLTLFLFCAVNAQTIKIGNLEVTSTDLVIPELQAKGMDPRYNYNDHVSYYLDEHPEWRLPTLDELRILYQNRTKLNMLGNPYMAYGVTTGSAFTDKYANQVSWVDFFASGKFDINLGTRCYIRLIKVK